MRAAIHLAEVNAEEPIPVGVIAEATGVPRNYLSKVLHQLVRAGLLVSERGPRGGFALALPAEEITVAKIVEAVDARGTDRRCLLGRGECRDSDPCPAHDQWQGLADRISDFLQETTLADMRRRT
jgi:Rrf2 family protein